MITVNLFRSAFEDAHETHYLEENKTLKEAFPDIDFTGAIIAVNGEYRDETALFQDGDICAVGLALKDTLGNIAAGIMLILLKSYRRGDFIEFGSFMGTVRNFDLFRTSLETPDGVFIYAPNSSIWASPMKNYSHNAKRRMELSVGIAYSDSIDAAFQVMRDLVSNEPRFLTDPEPQIVVQSLGESSITILLRAWAPSDVYWDIYWKHTRLIKEKIEGAGLSIPFPQRDIHLIGEVEKKEKKEKREKKNG
jgi:small conductance mechanosensitive channel